MQEQESKKKARERGLAGPALMTVAAATSLAAGTNQRRLVRSDLVRPCCARACTQCVRITLSPEKHVPGCEGSATLL